MVGDTDRATSTAGTALNTGPTIGTASPIAATKASRTAYGTPSARSPTRQIPPMIKLRST